MMETSYWCVPILGLIVIGVGIISLLKGDRWVMLLVESWPFHGFSNLEIKLMKLAWRIGGIVLIAFGLFLIIHEG